VRYGLICALAAVLAGSAVAQNVISAKSGLVHYTEGDVTVAGKPAAPTMTEFPEMKNGDELQTELGRAEVLLSPGVFLRVSESSAVRMVSNRLEDTKLELLAGSALLEVGELNAKEQQISVAVSGNTVEISKRGLFRFESNPAHLRVYDGSASVISGGQTITVKEGREIDLAGVPNPEKFDKDKGDAFQRWAARRSGYIAMANVSAAKRMYDNKTPCSAACWMFNPYFGAFTFIPMTGLYHSPFGWAYYSPFTIQRAYYRPPEHLYNPSNAGMGGGMSAGGWAGNRSSSDYGGGRSSMGGYSSVHASGAPASAPPPAAAAPAGGGGGRSADAGGGRGSRGGR
jgi:hypothetical protein